MTEKLSRYFRRLPPVSRRIAVTAIATEAERIGFAKGGAAGYERGWQDREALYVVQRRPVPSPRTAA